MVDSIMKEIRNLFRLKEETKKKKKKRITLQLNMQEICFRLGEKNDPIIRQRLPLGYFLTMKKKISTNIRNKSLSIKKYLDEIKPYLKNIISNFKKCHTLKIKSTIAINFISLKHTHEEPVIHSKSDIRKFMIYDKTDEVIEEHLESLEEH